MKPSDLTVIIIGLGPRGLGVALRLLDAGYRVIGIDPNPLQTWSSLQLINSMDMRSPTSFDLVSLCSKDIRNTYSLNRYISIYEDYKTYRDYEECNHYVSRDVFYSYINYLYKVYILGNNNFTLQEDRVIEIKYNQVRLSSNKVIAGNRIVIASGPGYKRIVPPWVNNSQVNVKLLGYQQILKEPPVGKVILVCGGGQAGAEYTKYLVDKGNYVYWVVRDKTIKVQQYPIPTYKDWQAKSCFSDFYRQLTIDPKHQIDYLEKVKAWGPSITPNINEELQSIKDGYTIVKEYDRTYNLSNLIKECDGIVLCTGFNISISALPINDHLELDSRSGRYPLLKSGFKASNGHYYTGVLATLYDGPRQNSLFSIGLTSQEILEDINKSL